jgi:tetratricopeptide (TPR) repeat protein
VVDAATSTWWAVGDGDHADMTKSPEPKVTASSGALGTETPQARVMQLVALAHNLCDDGRPAEAEDLARSLLGQTPNLPSAQVVMARAWAEQGRLDQARGMLEQVVTRNPAFFAAHRWLAEVLVALGDYPRASDVLLRAEAISPGQARVAELIQQVMGAPQLAPATPESGPSPAREPPPPPAPRRRRQTWEGPAVSDASPRLETLVPPPGGAKPAPTRAVPAPPTRGTAPLPPTRSSGQQAQPPQPPPTQTQTAQPSQAQPRQPQAAQQQAWNYAPPAPAAGTRGAVPQAARGPGLIRRISAWFRRHPSAVLTVAGVFLFTLAALAVVLTSWALRPRDGGTRADSPPPPRPESETGGGSPTTVVNEEEGPAPLGSGGFDELLSVLVKDRRLRAPRPTPSVNRALLASALLASEYGRPGDRPTEVLADELVAALGPEQPPEDLVAAQVLLRVARGDRAGAEATARALGLATGQTPLIRFVEARRLSRNGEGSAALARLGPDAERSPFPLGRLLLGELSLDRGEPDVALQAARAVLAQAPRHPLALQLLMEAHQAKGGRPPPDEAMAISQACKEDETRIPTLAAACRLDRALTLRRAGARRASLNAALSAAEVVPADPRLLSLAAQALSNLGAIREANLLLSRAEVLADRALPPLAWARIGVELATNRRVTIPESPPASPEARLVAARSAFVGPPDSPVLNQLLDSIRSTAGGDRDLQVITRGARARRAAAVLATALRLRDRYGKAPPGPVAAYVAGTLARRSGLRPLARVWLGQALTGHGDACRAATLFRLSLQDMGSDPLQNPRLQRAIGRLGCERLPK